MYIVLDIETTGFSPDQHEIIEFAAILIGGDYKEISAFRTLIKPMTMPDQMIVGITGIQPDRLLYAPTIQEVAPLIQQYVSHYPCIGHNIIKFDAPFLKKKGLLQSNQLIDTLDISRQRAQTDKHSLDFLCDYYNIERKRKHRALDDARATAKLYTYLQ